MKHLADTIRPFLLTVALLLSGGNVLVHAQERTSGNDSMEVSLLTCAPGQKLYSLYGHTALRLHNLHTGDDWAFNYGVFNTKKPYFVLRFLFGLTDYELGIVPMDVFMQEYTREGREVTEQVLNLTSDEKHKLIAALDKNYLPENRVYRYNYFYDNCTTRARDMLENCLDGRLKYNTSQQTGKGQSYRDMIHKHTELHPWAAYGNDLCLGLKSDWHTNWREQQFLPENLMHDMAYATIKGVDGRNYPAVLRTDVVVNGGIQIVESEFPLSPMGCSIVLLVLTLIVTAVELKTHKWYRLYDILLMAAQGLAGIIIMSLLFSQHPTTSTNMQALLLNPLPLFFLYKVARGQYTRYWQLSTVLIGLFLLGFFVQDYAEGIGIVALSLLVRSVANGLRQRAKYKYINEREH